ncbi:class I SAM-dependent methyltransferase [Actinoplanes friuliensis]|uniref:Putative methyltransferase n=1 Tax=Actinoplanes friuliensis DSM 7358 TaxID=1246995 RepID=U5W0V2_9ACTN|nr:class I SAM-dependent methyltransferase [Actinoplanes friuliensis]AGZ42637.1 putative methyltransferase [Actinoplanes friuliensis DSM 7358]
MSDHATSFGPVAALYERARPPYPREALEWLLPGGEPRVVDLGAGTGKLTRQIRDLGLPVTAVEPSDGMRAELARVLPGVTVLAGTAEEIPLPDASADVVLCAQAWHWVDPDRAVPEVARVLSPGGRLGLIWNLRDESVDWVRQLGEIIDSREMRRDDRIGAPFGPSETRDFTWTHRIGLDRLLDLVASRSYVILLPATERAAVLDRVRELAATHPDLAGRDTFELPYVTQCLRASLQD